MSTIRRRSIPGGFVPLLVFLGGCASGGPAGPSAPAPAATLAADADFEALYRDRRAGALDRFTDADIDFVTGMIGHHAQALVMAGLAPERSQNSSIRTLAARIVNGQEDEIATMERWLLDRGAPVPHVEIDGIALHVHGGDPTGPMPGMLSEAQLARLEAARGEAFDRLFLAFMIEHHEGAVEMVEALFRTDGAGQDEEVFRLASDIQVDQRTEIARMRRMLDELPAGND